MNAEDAQILRDAFVRRMTIDSVTRDGRRSTFNQAIFAQADEGGRAVYVHTDLAMVLAAFDRAVKDTL